MTPHCHLPGNPSPLSLPYGPVPPLFTVTSQGRLMTVKYRGHGKPPVKTAGSDCDGFGRTSRLAQISFLNILDIPACEPCLFVTLTIPDDCYMSMRGKLVQWRSDFWRRMEWKLGRTACMWRLEHKLRLTGLYPGEPFPHYHFMVFNCKYLSMNYVNEQWGKIIGHSGYLRTEVKPMENWTQTCFYVSKYLAKLEEPMPSLVFGINLNKGKKWGVLRKELVPICSPTVWSTRDAEMAKWLLADSRERWPGVPDQIGTGYRLFGHDREKLENLFGGLKCT